MLFWFGALFCRMAFDWIHGRWKDLSRNSLKTITDTHTYTPYRSFSSIMYWILDDDGSGMRLMCLGLRWIFVGERDLSLSWCLTYYFALPPKYPEICILPLFFMRKSSFQEGVSNCYELLLLYLDVVCRRCRFIYHTIGCWMHGISQPPQRSGQIPLHKCPGAIQCTRIESLRENIHLLHIIGVIITLIGRLSDQFVTTS